MAPSSTYVDHVIEPSRTISHIRSRYKVSVSSFAYGMVITFAVFCGMLFFLVHRHSVLLRSYVSSKKNDTVNASTYSLIFDPIIVNLADKDANAYLRLSMVVQVSSPVSKNISEANTDKYTDTSMAAMRDATLTVLGRETSEDLLAENGKKYLKERLKLAFAGCEQKIIVKEIYFRDFLVQR